MAGSSPRRAPRAVAHAPPRRGGLRPPELHRTPHRRSFNGGGATFGGIHPSASDTYSASTILRERSVNYDGGEDLVREHVTPNRLNPPDPKPSLTRQGTAAPAVPDARLEFLRTVVHELRTPLTPMRVQLYVVRERLRGAPADADLQHSLEILERSVTRMSRLLDETLDVSGIQSGRLRVHRQPSSVAQILRRAAELFEGQARQAGVEVFIDCEEPLEAAVDAERVAQVLENLLANALRHTPAGGTIVITGHAEPQHVLVGVHDTGAGLTPEEIESLFQPFSVARVPAKATRYSHGLGLYISQGIIEAHGGRLWCESPGPGRGATFLATLPHLFRARR